ncbi:MAG: PD40 domain-containing protein [Acidobacteria bacterium]|nr:PD40 domain-containing protein [Acidobacteriota bacterium]
MTGSRLSHYEILDKLGEGGMGVVYKARDTALNRFAALKVLSPERLSTDRRSRFLQEAQAASSLNHPNIVTIYEAGSDQGVDFIAMEFVAGRTLDHHVPSRGLRLDEAMRYAIPMADALAHAHAAGIVHRDLKPGNVIVNEQGAPKLLDFGLAKLTHGGGSSGDAQTASGAPRTEDGAILGTVSYMSPEQARAEKVDGRSDVFAFGALLYEMLSGKRAFAGADKISTLAAILNQEPRPIHELAEGLPHEAERIIARCLRKDPARRFQTMADLKVALEEVRDESASGKLDAPAPPPRSSRKLWWIGGAAVVAAAAVAGWIWRSSRPAATEQALRPIPLTSFTGNEVRPSLSPDGSQVAFAWDGESGDNYDIYVKLVDGGTQIQLTKHPADDTAPAWSPDGRYIAFLREGAIFLITPLGGPERKVAEVQGDGLSWTEDSQSLVAVDRPSGQDPTHLALISLASGEKKKLTSPPANFIGDFDPAVSPDGKTIALVRHLSPNSGDILAMPIGGGEPRMVTKGIARGIAWTPDGRELLLGRGNIVRVPLGGSSSHPVTNAGLGSYPTISSKGTPRLAFQESVGDANIWRLDIADPRDSPPAKRLIASTREDMSPSISPDGKQIAFRSNRDGRPAIFVCDQNGSNPAKVLALGSNVGRPRWSPDGKRLSFDVWNQPERPFAGVWISGADGAAPHVLADTEFDEVRSSWSADGRWVYFRSDRSGRHQIWKAPSGGGEAIQATKQGGYEAFESVDGQTLYYVKEAPGESRIRNVSQGRLAGTLWSMAPVSNDGAGTRLLDGVWPSNWGVAVNGVYFLDLGGRPNAPKPVKHFDPRTRRIRQVGSFPLHPGLGHPSFAVSRDGRWILSTQIENAGSDLMLIDHFR